MSAYFPLSFFTDFLDYTSKHSEKYEFLTYDQLDWGDDYNYAESYPTEFKNWQQGLGEKWSRDKAYIFLQHDVDSTPRRTLKFVEHQKKVGVRSNLMIFAERFDRGHYRETKEFRNTPYFDNLDTLKKIEDDGFLIGYHNNSYERSRFNPEEAKKIMHEDVTRLRENFNIQFFSPHGGPPCSEKKSNNSIEPPLPLRDNLRWVANRFTVKVHGSFSDGGMNSPKRSASDFDLKEFVSQFKTGCRYRILLHPQYYDENFEYNKKLKSEWYDQVCSGQTKNYWSEAKLPTSPQPPKVEKPKKISIKNRIKRKIKAVIKGL